MGQPDAPLAPEDLLPFLEALDCRGTLHVAFSGGVDSTALLLALKQLGPQLAAPLAAVHVNHGAHPDAAAWAEHCRVLCESLGIPLVQVPPPREPLPKDSPEAQWRRWRLEAFKELLETEDVVLTAHHRQDQAESLLLALLRSSGPDGLAAMPAVRPLGKGRLGRPFLDLPRESLVRFVTQQGVRFIEDPGNRDLSLDRNYLRHELMPVLERRWPAAERSLARSAGLFAGLSAQLAQEGALALAGREPFPGVLELGALPEHPQALALVIRHWLRERGAAPLPRARLEDLVGQLRRAAPDRQINFQWAEHRLDHAQNRLWLMTGAPDPCRAISHWDAQGTAQLGATSGTLSLGPVAADGAFRIASRTGGERYQSTPDGPRRKLKQWFNDSRLPPWYRCCVPLLFHEDRLLAVGDVVLDRSLEAQLASRDGTLKWHPGDPLLAWAWQECRQNGLQVK